MFMTVNVSIIVLFQLKPMWMTARLKSSSAATVSGVKWCLSDSQWARWHSYIL